MSTVPAHNFCEPTREKFTAAARSIPGVCAVLLSRVLLLMTRTPSVRQSMFGFNYFSREAINVPAAFAPLYENTPNHMNPSNENSVRVRLRLPPLWTIGAPVFAGLVLAAAGFGWARGTGGILVAIVALGLAGAVFAAVHHADVVAHRVGQPYGTLVL